MTFKEEIKKTVGEEVYRKLEKESDKEVGLAIKMELVNKYGDDQYYQQRFLVDELFIENELFEKNGIKVTPLDIVNVLFRCKLLFAVKTDSEYRQRSGSGSYVDEFNFIVPWTEKSKGVDVLISQYFDRLKTHIKERTLVTNIDCFHHYSTTAEELHEYFEGLFHKLNIPLVCFFEGKHLTKLHKQYEPRIRKYSKSEGKKFFYAPSFGFTCTGSENYCYWYSSTWLRTFFNLLRVSGFLFPGQIDFGQSDVQIMAPKIPSFLGTQTSGYCWDEDKKESWAKIPDGSLFLSFGYRGISKLWIDSRSFKTREEFILTNKKIFDSLRNPWESRNLNDIAPTMDILSSATQIFDLGAKILLLYCSLEHLFVPKTVTKNNKIYIVGGINALMPDLLPWFERLYALRCDYAHKGFVLKNKNLLNVVDQNKTLGLIMESFKNIMLLLSAKLG